LSSGAREPRRLAVDSAVALALIGTLVALVYGGHLDNPLVFDSAFWFSRQNLPTLQDLSTSDRLVSRQVAYFVYRLADGRLAVYRAVHFALHVGTAWSLFLLFRRLFAELGASPPSRRMSFGPALAIALLFALHPVQVYAVGDPGQMELVLATLFSVLLLRVYLEGLLRASRPLLLASALLYPLAVLSKENSVAIPAVAAALTLLVRSPSPVLVRQLSAWYAIAGLVAALIVAGEVAQHRDAPGSGPLRPDTPMTAPSIDPGHTRARSAVTQAHLFFRYWLLWVVPDVRRMSIDLRLPSAAGVVVWPETAGAVAFAVYPIAPAWLLLKRGRAGLVGFGLLWPWLMFLPELAAPRLTETFVLYRSYLWIPGPLAALVAALTGPLGRLALPLLCAVCVALGGLAYERLRTFRSAYAVWDDAVRKSRAYERAAPAAHRPYLNRGRALLDLGRLDAALRDFDMALELEPGLAYAHWNRALVYIAKNDPARAFVAFDEGFATASRLPATARARAYSNRAGLHLRLGRSHDALEDLQRALALDPARAEFRRNAELLAEEIRRAEGAVPRRPTAP
jgi:protein O-mannosyl-transferase